MTDSAEFERYLRAAQATSGRQGAAVLFTILLFLALAVFWAATTELDDVTRVDGRIIPSQQLQIVQAAEGGVLEQLHVREGDIVAPGQLLMTLDAAGSLGDLGQRQQRALALEIRIRRLRAEIDDAPLQFSTTEQERAPALVISEAALHAGRQRERQSERVVLERQLEQRRRELEETRTDQTTAAETLSLVREELDLVKPLVERNLEPETTLIGLKRSVSEWRGRVVRAEAASRRLGAAIAETEARLQALHDQFSSEALAQLADATAELATLQPTLPALAARVARAEVRAPVRGIVNQILLTTHGGVAQAGQALLEIVPLDDHLLVEAYVPPEDIAFLHAGQAARVKLSAYDFARYGALAGEVVRIAAGASQRPDRTPPETVFVIELRASGRLRDADGAPLEVIPGMIAEVDILKGRKTVLDYLLRPVVRVKDRAFRD